MNRNGNPTSVNRRRFVGSAAALAAGAALAGQSEHASANEDKLQESKIKLPPMHDGIKPEKAGPAVMNMMQEWLGPTGDMLTSMCAAAAENMGKYTPIANQWGSQILH